MQTAKDPRRALLAMVHVAKREMELEDPVYRSVMQRLFGVTTAGALTVPQLEHLIYVFESTGWKRKRPKPMQRCNRASNRQLSLIQNLWKELCDMGAARNPHDQGLRRFVKRTAGVDSLDWMTPKDASNVIEGLKAWKARQKTTPSPRTGGQQ